MATTPPSAAPAPVSVVVAAVAAASPVPAPTGGHAVSILNIIKVNDKRTGVKEGRPWELQDAECILLTDTGEYKQVGVLSLPRHLRGDAAPAPGTYLGSFGLSADLRTRRIEAVLLDLRPYSVGKV